MILGIDCSTSVVGYTILDNKGKLERIGFISIGGFEDLLEKARFLKFMFEDILKDYDIEYIYIEDISKKFHEGFSSASVITTLARFNGIVSYMLYELKNVKPTYFPASSARRLAYNRSYARGLDIKKEVFKEVMKLEPQLIWPKTKETKKHKSRAVSGSFDATDSYTMARVGLIDRKLL